MSAFVLYSGIFKSLLLTIVPGNTFLYLLGAFIAFLLFIYLIYTLFKPDKF